MSEPIAVDIPHTLGRAGARAKLEAGIAQLGAIVPGGRVAAQRWAGDTLHFAVEAMGQRVAAQVEVQDDRVRALIDLPPMLALFAGKLRDKLGSAGAKLLR